MKSTIEKYELYEINFDRLTGELINFDYSYPHDFLEEFRDVVKAEDWTFDIRANKKECYYK